MAGLKGRFLRLVYQSIWSICTVRNAREFVKKRAGSVMGFKSCIAQDAKNINRPFIGTARMKVVLIRLSDCLYVKG
jgi:hypothetical protein